MSHNEGGSVKSSYLNLTPKRKCGHDADGLIAENCHMLQALSDTTDLILLLLKRHSEDRSLLIPPPLSPQVLTSPFDFYLYHLGHILINKACFRF